MLGRRGICSWRWLLLVGSSRLLLRKVVLGVCCCRIRVLRSCGVGWRGRLNAVEMGNWSVVGSCCW